MTRCALIIGLVLAVPATAQSDQPWARQLLGDEAAASGAFVCEASVTNGRWSGVCYHRPLRALRLAEQAFAGRSNYRAQVCEALALEQHTPPAGALEVSASGSVGADGSMPDSVTVYHLLYMPFSTEASMAIADDDPGGGRPWLHQAGTCTAHVMWSERRAM